MINDFSFGHMTIDGKAFNSDLIVCPDGRIQESWWRKSGHVLDVEDITELIGSAPEVIIAGTGAYGVLKPADELPGLLVEKGIEFMAVPTGEAVKLYNELSEVKRVGGCFHLTC
jgi:hypothetical protein